MMKPYERYKEATIPWMKEIPTHWDCCRISHLFDENKDTNALVQETNALQFKFGELIKKKKLELNEELKKTMSKYTIVRPLDIMVNGLNLNYDFVTQRIGLVKQPGIITSAYISIRSRSHIEVRYFALLLKSLDARKVFNGMGNGIRLTLDYSELKSLQVPVPPRDEQDQIVLFLDWQLSKINKLIKAKKKQIALLREQKQAIINKAVTKGGEGWREISLGNLGSFRKGFGGSRIDDDENGAACIRYGDIYRTGVLSLTQPITRISWQSTNLYARIYKGELLFALSGETKDEIGQALVNSIEEDTWTSGDAGIFTADSEVLPRFLSYFLHCTYIVKQRASLAKGDIIVHISTSALKQMRILLPPILEQIEITADLDRKCTIIERSIEQQNIQIALFNEYRTSLISSVVTGKVDVRDVVVPDFEVDVEVLDDEAEISDDDIEASEVDE